MTTSSGVLVRELPVLRDGTPPCADYDGDCTPPLDAAGRPTCHLFTAAGPHATVEAHYLDCWLYDTSRGYCVMLVRP